MGFPNIQSTTKDVTTAGTAEALAASANEELVIMIVIEAKAGNTANMYVGGPTVDSTNGITLAPGDTFTFSGKEFKGTDASFDLSSIYLDTDTSGDGVKILKVIS